MIPAEPAQGWFRMYTAPSSPELTLLCFPWAGAGGSVFRSWRTLLPPDVALWSARLPGREDRLREPPCDDLEALVAELVTAVRPATSRPYALFGHSFGAVLALHVAHTLIASGLPPAAHLFVSGALPPGTRLPYPPLSELPDQELVAALVASGGEPAHLLNDPDLRGLLLPALRADLRMADSHRQTSPGMLSIPLTVLTAVDDPLAPAAAAWTWQAHTSAAFRLRKFHGGHLFPVSQAPAVVATVVAELAHDLHQQATSRRCIRA